MKIKRDLFIIRIQDSIKLILDSAAGPANNQSVPNVCKSHQMLSEILQKSKNNDKFRIIIELIMQKVAKTNSR